jgi:hypothetical protein
MDLKAVSAESMDKSALMTNEKLSVDKPDSGNVVLRVVDELMHIKITCETTPEEIENSKDDILQRRLNGMVEALKVIQMTR